MFTGLVAVNNSPSEARIPTTCSREPAILQNAQVYCAELDGNGSRNTSQEFEILIVSKS